jgi:hypothetical protein
MEGQIGIVVNQYFFFSNVMKLLHCEVYTREGHNEMETPPRCTLLCWPLPEADFLVDLRQFFCQMVELSTSLPSLSLPQFSVW